MKKSIKNKKIIVLAGSGSGGPVTPLLAVAETIAVVAPETEFIFIGTRGGVEERLVKNAGIRYRSIVSGKLHRYWTLKNIVAPFQICIGFIQSYKLLHRVGADCVFGAGGFVQVPVMWAAWLLGIPVVVHQQDVEPGLANTLCAPIAHTITVTFTSSLLDFPPGWILRHIDSSATERLVWTGNPVRPLVLPERRQAVQALGLDVQYPTVLVMGGGTGSLALNELVVEALPRLTRFVNVIHITGRGRGAAGAPSSHYKPFEFIADMGTVYGACDIVLARAGLGTITELALIHRPAIIVPMPGSHQEANAALLADHDAALVLQQAVLNPENIASLIRGLLFEHALQKRLVKNMTALMPENATVLVADVLLRAAGARPQTSAVTGKHVARKKSKGKH